MDRQKAAGIADWIFKKKIQDDSVLSLAGAVVLGIAIVAVALGSFVDPGPGVMVGLGIVALVLTFASLLFRGMTAAGFATLAIALFVITGRINSLGLGGVIGALLALSILLSTLMILHQWIQAGVVLRRTKLFCGGALLFSVILLTIAVAT